MLLQWDLHLDWSHADALTSEALFYTALYVSLILVQSAPDTKAVAQPIPLALLQAATAG